VRRLLTKNKKLDSNNGKCIMLTIEVNSDEALYK